MTRDASEPRPPPEFQSIDLLYRDEAIVVVDKPSGLSVHRGDDPSATVALNLTRDTIGRWVYPVHRLDRPTSGVLVFALSSDYARVLQGAFEQRRVDKRYLALVRGRPPESGIVDSPMEKREGGPTVEAVTEFRTLCVCPHVRLALVEARPKTGRRHQIRRHLRRIDHPIAGDVRYGKGVENRSYRVDLGLYRLGLHALELSFDHPASGVPVRFSSPIPGDLRAPLRRAGVPERILGFAVPPSPN